MTMRTDGYRRKIFLCYRAIFSPARDDSRNDSPFAENLDTRLKSSGPANYRHYTTSHDTRPCERYTRNCYVFSRLHDFYSNSFGEKVSGGRSKVVASADLFMQKPSLFIFNNGEFSTARPAANKISPLKTLLRGTLRSPRN